MERLINDNPIGLFDIFFRDFLDPRSIRTFHSLDESKISHPVNIIAEEDQLIIEIAAVGADKEDLSISAEDGMLRIKYDKKEKNRNVQYLHRSIAKRSFDIAYKISSTFNIENIEASLDKGLLTIFIPKKTGNIKQIEIKTPKAISRANAKKELLMEN